MTRIKVLKCRTPARPADLAIDSQQLPQATGRQVLVEVKATSVNPIDVKRAAGYGRRLLGLKGARLPSVLGNDVVGVVKSAGPRAGGWQEGELVFGFVPPGAIGAHCSAVLVDERLLRRAPAHCAPQQLAALPYSFTTMLLALHALGLNKDTASGKHVLIHGASGALGLLALQLLVSWGARVTAVCGTQGLHQCLELGAEQVIDRHEQPLDTLTRTYDASLNFASWEEDATLLMLLKPKALGHATTVHPLLDNFDRLGWSGGLAASVRSFWKHRRLLGRHSASARYRWVVFKPDGRALDALQTLLETDAPLLPIGIAVPFERASEAFAHVTQGRPGRAILLPVGA